MKQLFNFFKTICPSSDDKAHTIDNVYHARIYGEDNAEKLQAAKEWLGEKYILHPIHNVKKKRTKVRHFAVKGEA